MHLHMAGRVWVMNPHVARKIVGNYTQSWATMGNIHKHTQKGTVWRMHTHCRVRIWGIHTHYRVRVWGIHKDGSVIVCAMHTYGKVRV